MFFKEAQAPRGKNNNNNNQCDATSEGEECVSAQCGLAATMTSSSSHTHAHTQGDTSFPSSSAPRSSVLPHLPLDKLESRALLKGEGSLLPSSSSSLSSSATVNQLHGRCRRSACLRRSQDDGERLAGREERKRRRQNKHVRRVSGCRCRTEEEQQEEEEVR